MRGHGRENELEADRLGARYLVKSGYDPAGMLQVVGVLKDQEAFDKLVAEQEGRAPTTACSRHIRTTKNAFRKLSRRLASALN